jgi:hypothetical protein
VQERIGLPCTDSEDGTFRRVRCCGNRVLVKQHPKNLVQHQRPRIYDNPPPMSAPSIHADPPPEVVRDPEGLQYETGPQLGKGGFAICHRAKLLGHDHLGSSTVALKIVKSKMEPPKLAQKVHYE